MRVGGGRNEHAGKRDHREVLRDDYVVVRPGPNFDWFMAGMAAAQPMPAPPEPNPVSDDKHETTALSNFHRRIGAAAVGSLGCALARLGQDEREQPRALLLGPVSP